MNGDSYAQQHSYQRYTWPEKLGWDKKVMDNYQPPGPNSDKRYVHFDLGTGKYTGYLKDREGG